MPILEKLNGASPSLTLAVTIDFSRTLLDAFVTPQRARTLLFEGFRRIVMAFDVEGHFVWGATASMLRDLARRLRDD